MIRMCCIRWWGSQTKRHCEGFFAGGIKKTEAICQLRSEYPQGMLNNERLYFDIRNSPSE